MKYKDLCVRILPVVIHMEGNIVNKFFGKLKNKFSTSNQNNYPQNSDYAFSFEELNTLEKQNKEKIKELKKEVIESSRKKNTNIIKKETFDPLEIKEVASKNQDIDEINNKKDLDKVDNESLDDNNDKDTVIEIETVVENKDSFINLSEERKKIIMTKWSSIDIVKLDKYINNGKDILAHNYTITYGDDALKYIYMVRDEYNILIEYLIGFNNEKKGIYNKIIFSDRLDNEWRYLANYIKILEKIRSVKK